MIHEDLSSGRKKENGAVEVGRAAALSTLVSIMRRFSEHEFPRLRTTAVQFIHPRTPRRNGGGRKKYCAINGLTCPCCSAAPPLLDCSPWTDSCCCIHSSVSLQKRRETENEDSLLYSRLTDRRNFSWETTWAPRQVFPAVQNVNAIQRDVVYILRNAYEIVLYRERHNIRGKLAVR